MENGVEGGSGRSSQEWELEGEWELERRVGEERRRVGGEIE